MTRPDPHLPRPREGELPNGDLAVVRDRQLSNSAVTVPAEDRALYECLMAILWDSHVPDTMPANLAVACEDLIEVLDIVSRPDRGIAWINGSGYGLSYCHAVRRAIEERHEREPVTLVAVGCSGTKTTIDEPLPAADRYEGGYWTNKREYYETVGDDGRIISAEHGLLDPAEPIEYYETHIEDLDGIPVDHDGRLPSGDEVTTLVDLWALSVHDSLSKWIDDAAGGVDPRDVELQVLLGKPYHNRLRDRDVFAGLRARGDLTISFPFREEVDYSNGGGIGNQRSWMVDEIEAATVLATDGGEQR
ncbi:DUF6884 domain-containing protein [Halovivax cerinus]|uniref:DUF6884 domain-containing protein n=1 Tax=Halovivax cerinus TaxID=1487865 RepID=A0ABD5NLB4_9EURY|nr:DUF6884 domain-containing protein [Halovivax cerinus]